MTPAFFYMQLAPNTHIGLYAGKSCDWLLTAFCSEMRVWN
jgi:hypothetical protein